MHAAIVGPRVAMENAPQASTSTRATMQQLYKEMESMQVKIVAEAKEHVDMVQEKAKMKVTRRFAKLRASIIATIQEAIKDPIKREEKVDSVMELSN